MDTDTPDSDEQLAELLDRLLQQHRSGDPVEWSEIRERHPELADELRDVWEAALISERLASWDRKTHGSNSWLDIDRSPADPLDVVDVVDFGDYRIDEEIGRGGMGVVYRAWQFSLRRSVALKRILRGDMASPIDIARFRSEAESAARLRHPHIVSIYEVGTHDGLPYFSMQYVPGTTLAERISRGPLPSREAAELLVPICHAIAHAHRQGVLHRDLKPSNILIDNEGTPIVTDFGLAKWLETEEADRSESASADAGPLTFSGAILGTPSYLSPEQAAGRRNELGIVTDVYGLGAVLYAMLTGRPPFQAATPMETLSMVLEQDPAPPRLLQPNVDRDLEMITLKCLQKPADLRYASADELADDLERYLANEPIRAQVSHIGQIISRAFRETHHASVLRNWGLLWMWHSVMLMLLCVVTNVLLLQGVSTRWPYVALWGGGMGVWAAVFWELRRRAGPITFVERQIAHLWAGSMIADMFLFAVEWQLGLHVLELSPVLALVGGIVFLVKAVLLNGIFYVQAAALFATSVLMAYIAHSGLPDVSITLLGIVLAGSFFFPGLKYYREIQR